MMMQLVGLRVRCTPPFQRRSWRRRRARRRTPFASVHALACWSSVFSSAASSLIPVFPSSVFKRSDLALWFYSFLRRSSHTRSQFKSTIFPSYETWSCFITLHSISQKKQVFRQTYCTSSSREDWNLECQVFFKNRWCNLMLLSMNEWLFHDLTFFQMFPLFVRGFIVRR